MYRNDQIRKYQIFAYSDWPGGLFGSIGMAGTRPGRLCVCKHVCLLSCLFIASFDPKTGFNVLYRPCGWSYGAYRSLKFDASHSLFCNFHLYAQRCGLHLQIAL